MHLRKQHFFSARLVHAQCICAYGGFAVGLSALKSGRRSASASGTGSASVCAMTRRRTTASVRDCTCAAQRTSILHSCSFQSKSTHDPYICTRCTKSEILVQERTALARLRSQFLSSARHSAFLPASSRLRLATQSSLTSLLSPSLLHSLAPFSGSFSLSSVSLRESKPVPGRSLSLSLQFARSTLET